MSEHAVQVIRSDPEIHFTTAIAKQTYEMASLPMLMNVSNKGEIVGIKVSSTDDLDWIVWIFTRSNGHSETLSIEQTNADAPYSVSTIIKNSWTVIDDQYNGYEVEMYGGTSSGDTRTIVDTQANSGNGKLVIEPPWTTLPTATSDFRIHSRDPFAGHVKPTATDPPIFDESGFRADLLYRFESRLYFPYRDDENGHRIHVALFNDEASSAKTAYSSGGRVQVQIDFRPHRGG